jgi:uncharacterized protein (DUF1330 family)
MAAYVIVQAEITDSTRFKEYLKESPAIIVQHGGKYLARGGEMVALEGENPNKRVVLLEFPSLEQAKNWYCSADYQRNRKLREGAAKGSLIAIEGC